MRELGRRDSRGGEQGWQGWRGRPSSLWCQGVRCCVVPPWPDSGARLRPSCRPQPAIPAGWIWFYWFDPVSEWLLEAAAAAPAPAPAAAAAAARRSAAAAAVRPAFLLLLPPPTNTGPCAAPPTAAGYSLYGLVASQLGDVTTPTTLPDGGVRGASARLAVGPHLPARLPGTYLDGPTPPQHKQLALPFPRPAFSFFLPAPPRRRSPSTSSSRATLGSSAPSCGLPPPCCWPSSSSSASSPSSASPSSTSSAAELARRRRRELDHRWCARMCRGPTSPIPSPSAPRYHPRLESLCTLL